MVRRDAEHDTVSGEGVAQYQPGERQARKARELLVIRLFIVAPLAAWILARIMGRDFWSMLWQILGNYA